VKERRMNQSQNDKQGLKQSQNNRPPSKSPIPSFVTNLVMRKNHTSVSRRSAKGWQLQLRLLCPRDFSDFLVRLQLLR
jgi:hypothetical protein